MLVLSRRVGEDVLLPDLEIVVRVLKVRGNVVSIGIEAPPEMHIVRSELVQSQRRFAPKKIAPKKTVLQRVAC